MLKWASNSKPEAELQSGPREGHGSGFGGPLIIGSIMISATLFYCYHVYDYIYIYIYVSPSFATIFATPERLLHVRV